MVNTDGATDHGFYPITGPKHQYPCVADSSSPKRLVASARHTFPLQRVGLKDIGNQTRLKRISAFGTQEQYCLRQNWNDQQVMIVPIDSSIFSNRSTILLPSNEDQATGCHSTQSAVATIEQHSPVCRNTTEKISAYDVFWRLLSDDDNAVVSDDNPADDLGPDILDYSNWRWKRKSNDETTWLDPNPNSVSCTFGATEFFSDGRVCLELLKLGIVPICQFRKKGGRCCECHVRPNGGP